MRSFSILIVLTGLLTPVFGQGKYFEISKNLELFSNAYRELNYGYVDELDPGQVMRLGLDAILEGMDPYTNYISENDVETFRLQSEGKYNGFGAQGKLIGDYFVVTEILEFSPAHNSGIKIGDAILRIEGQSAKGKSESEVLAFLRGFPGTEIRVDVRRPGTDKEMKIMLKREEVNVPNVPHHGIVAPNIGYVNLTTFTADAGENIASAIRDMKINNPELKGLVLDLRGNGGGLLNEAVNIVNLFVPKGEYVVSTKGKVPEWDRAFKTLNAPLDLEIPVIVLIDKYSASASEIVSGALQDLDRAVLMGQRSYGKGLVQNIKEIGYNSRIKLTTAKYYIPSGRCIQAVRYKNGEPVDIPDTDRAPFKTRGGRTVLDGGGVKPDVVLPVDTATGIVKALLDGHVIFDYVTQFVLAHATIDSAENFVFSDWDQFVGFVKNRKFEYIGETEKQLQTLRQSAEKENLALSTELQALENKIKNTKQDELTRNKARIVREIEEEIVSRYYFQRGKVKKRLKNDPEVAEAVKLLNDKAKYESYLGKTN